MTYRELLEQYKKNELDEVKKNEIEAEIEKQEAISDYLYERAEIPELEEAMVVKDLLFDEAQMKQELEFTKLVKRSIRKAFLKMGTVVGLVILLILLFSQMVLPKLVSEFYYNPGKEITQNLNQMGFDLMVYTNLTMPGSYRDNVTVEDNGYGSYDICINQVVSYDDRFINLPGKIERGKLTLYDVNILKRPTGNAFAWFQMRGDTSDSLRDLVSSGQQTFGAAGTQGRTPENAKAEILKLEDNTKYSAYITLDRMMDYSEFIKFLNRNDYYAPEVWCAVYTNGGMETREERLIIDNLGFTCTLSRIYSIDWNREKYPNLLIAEDAQAKGAGLEELEKNILREDYMQTHFVSMLRYMSDQKEFLTMMKESPELLSNAADYIEKNGLKIYGFAMLADKEELLKTNGQEEVFEIYIVPSR
jgi:hypothetical protein